MATLAPQKINVPHRGGVADFPRRRAEGVSIQDTFAVVIDGMMEFEHGQDRPLDAFDYELATRADKEDDQETVSLETALQHLGLTHADLQG